MDRIQSSSSRKAKLTTSIISKTIEECRKDIDEAVEKKADIIELRVDFLEQKLRDDENLMKEAIEVLVA